VTAVNFAEGGIEQRWVIGHIWIQISMNVEKGRGVRTFRVIAVLYQQFR